MPYDPNDLEFEPSVEHFESRVSNKSQMHHWPWPCEVVNMHPNLVWQWIVDFCRVAFEWYYLDLVGSYKRNEVVFVRMSLPIDKRLGAVCCRQWIAFWQYVSMIEPNRDVFVRGVRGNLSSPLCHASETSTELSHDLLSLQKYFSRTHNLTFLSYFFVRQKNPHHDEW